MSPTQIAMLLVVLAAVGAAVYVATRPPPPPPPQGLDRILGGIGNLVGGIVDLV
jgi:hypothetical protein